MKFLLIICALFISINSIAQERCDTILGKIEYLQCKQNEYRRLDSILNATIKEMSEKLGPLEQQDFITAQQYWCKYQKKYCDCYSIIAGGNQSQRNYYDCLILTIQERLQELKIFNFLK
jgi:uncharacterized protein YecT (DUF1311 family)